MLSVAKRHRESPRRERRVAAARRAAGENVSPLGQRNPGAAVRRDRFMTALRRAGPPNIVDLSVPEAAAGENRYARARCSGMAFEEAAAGPGDGSWSRRVRAAHG